jgi:hypothetical protein
VERKGAQPSLPPEKNPAEQTKNKKKEFLELRGLITEESRNSTKSNQESNTNKMEKSVIGGVKLLIQSLDVELGRFLRKYLCKVLFQFTVSYKTDLEFVGNKNFECGLRIAISPHNSQGVGLKPSGKLERYSFHCSSMV